MGKTECLLCPVAVAALLSYIERRELDSGALFRLEDKRPLTRDKFVREVRQALKAAGYDEDFDFTFSRSSPIMRACTHPHYLLLYYC